MLSSHCGDNKQTQDVAVTETLTRSHSEAVQVVVTNACVEEQSCVAV